MGRLLLHVNQAAELLEIKPEEIKVNQRAANIGSYAGNRVLASEVMGLVNPDAEAIVRLLEAFGLSPKKVLAELLALFGKGAKDKNEPTQEAAG